MFCSNCGQKLNPTDHFCNNCGISLYSDANSVVNKPDNESKTFSKILVIVIIVISMLLIYLFYNMRINQKVALVEIPYANQTIEPGTEITAKMLSKMAVPKSFLKGSYYYRGEDILGKCSLPNARIAKGSIFYSDLIIDCDMLNSFYGEDNNVIENDSIYDEDYTLNEGNDAVNDEDDHKSSDKGVVFNGNDYSDVSEVTSE